MNAGITSVIAACIALQCPTTLVAQQPAKPPPSPTNPCEARPDNQGETPQRKNSDDLSRCNGVLNPPAAMHDPIEKQPSHQGDTPVIRPEELPQKQKPQ